MPMVNTVSRWDINKHTVDQARGQYAYATNNDTMLYTIECIPINDFRDPSEKSAFEVSRVPAPYVAQCILEIIDHRKHRYQ